MNSENQIEIQRYSSSIDELKNGCYVAYMEPDSLGAWVKFSDYVKLEQKYRIAMYEDIIDDFRTQLECIQEALGVPTEPHQTLNERILEAARQAEEITKAAVKYEAAFTEVCRLYDEEKPFDEAMLIRELTEKVLIDAVRKYKELNP